MAVGGIMLNKGEIAVVKYGCGIKLDKGKIEVVKYGCRME